MSVDREWEASPQQRCSPCNQGCWGALCSWGRQEELGCPPTPAASTGCGSSWAGLSCTSWAASPLPSGSSYNHWHTSSASPYFYFPFLVPSSFFPPFFQELPRPSDPRQPHTVYMCTLSPDLHLSLLVHAHVWPCNVHFPVCLPIIFYITSGELVPEESRRRSC